MQPRVSGWQVPVLAVSALRDQGISETLDILDKFQIQYMGPGLTDENRAEQSRHWLHQEVRDGLIDLCRQDPMIAARLKTLENDVKAGRVVATVAARRLVDEIAQRRTGTQS
jgi:LAO/AO transport system kinase